MSQVKRLNIDRIGACASTICAVHCLVTGVALGVLSVFGLGFVDSPIIDLVFLSLAALIGIVAMWHGARVHKSLVPAAIFTFGLGLVIVGHFVFGHEASGPNAASTSFSILGGISLVGFHLLNLKLQRDRKCCHEAHCPHEGKY